MFASLLGLINADPHDTDSGVVKLVQILLETSQLEVTIPSPITSVKNQQDGFWWLVVKWLS